MEILKLKKGSQNSKLTLMVTFAQVIEASETDDSSFQNYRPIELVILCSCESKSATRNLG